MRRLLVILALVTAIVYVQAAVLVPFQLKVYDSNVPISSGDLQVTIYDQSSGGNLVYDSLSDFDDAIINGQVNITLGSGQALDLNYGQVYYMDLEVNGSDIDFAGSERQRFESNFGTIYSSRIGNGAISNTQVNGSAAIDWTKISKTGSSLADFTTRNASLLNFDADFNGMFVRWADANSVFINKTDGNNWYGRKTFDENITGNWTFSNATYFGGGFSNGGITIQNGTLYTQNIVIANDFNSATVTAIDVNGNYQPFIDNAFNLGGSSNRWQNIYGVAGTFTSLLTTSLSSSTLSVPTITGPVAFTGSTTFSTPLSDGNLATITANGKIGYTALPQADLNAYYARLNASNTGDLNVSRNIKAEGNYLCNATTCYLISDLNNLGSGTTDTNWQTSFGILDANLRVTFYTRSQLDTNFGNYSKTSDLNAAIGSGNIIRYGNNISLLTNDAGYLTSASDTNWETSWITFDANNKTYYYTKSQVDTNFLKYYTKGEVDANFANYTKTVDLNAAIGSSGLIRTGSNISLLTNDAGFITSATDTNWQTSWVILDANNRFYYYTKSQTDANFTNYYTKGQVDSNFLNFYTRNQIDTNFLNFTKTTDLNTAIGSIGIVRAGDNISRLVNDAGYITVAVADTNWQTSWLVFDANNRTYYYTRAQVDANFLKYYTKTQVDANFTNFTATDDLNTAIGSAGIVRAGDNISRLVNDAGFITAFSDTNWQTSFGLFDTNMMAKYYTKTQVDANFLNHYTKAQIDTNFTNFYTRAQIDSNFLNFYTRSQIDNNFTNFTKTTDLNAAIGSNNIIRYGNNISLLSNDAGYITSATDTNWQTSWITFDTNNKTYYYTRSQVDANFLKYYTKGEVDTNFGNYTKTADLNTSIGSSGIVRVGANISVLTNDAGYITSFSDTNWQTSWILFDTNNRFYYYTKAQVDNNFTNYYTKSQVDTNLANYVKITDVNTAIGSVGVVRAGDNVSRLVNDAGYLTSISTANLPHADLNTWFARLNTISVGDLNLTGFLKTDRNFLCNATTCYLISDLNRINPTMTDTNWQTSFGTLDANLRVTFYTRSQVDANFGNYTKTTDLNTAIGSAGIVRVGDNISQLVNDSGFITSFSDTNWQTGWIAFDVNNRAYYYTKTQVDTNFANYYTRAQVDTNFTNFTKTTDLNAIIGSNNIVRYGANISLLNNDSGYLTAVTAFGGQGNVQYNDGNVLNGVNDFNWNNGSKLLWIGGDLNVARDINVGRDVNAGGSLFALGGLKVNWDVNATNIFGNVDWNQLRNYPSACQAGQAITAIGDSITCTAFGGGGSSSSGGNQGNIQYNDGNGFNGVSDFNWNNGSKLLWIGGDLNVARDINVGNDLNVHGNFYTLGNSTVRDLNADGNVIVSGFIGAGSLRPLVSQDVNGGFAIAPDQITATSDVTILADNQAVTVGNRSYIRLTSDNSTNTNRTFTLSDGLQVGQILILQVATDAGTNEIHLADSGTVNLVTLWPAATNQPADSLMLIWTGTIWVEVSRSAN